MKDASPLRYPGGKWRLSNFLERTIQLNDLEGCQYVEPYAGGASLGLSLLITGCVTEIHLNDLDPAIYSFWHAILKRRQEFLSLVRNTQVTPDEWHRQKDVYASGLSAGRVALGFATFFLNRTNHSGILNAGMIGGNRQAGTWTIAARFNKEDLIRRIERVGQFKNRIHIYCDDAIDFLRKHRFTPKTLRFLDPPYYEAGRRLYLSAYHPEDHATVSQYITRRRCPWVVSYDDVPAIRQLYGDVRSRRFSMLHTARSPRMGTEVMFFAPGLRIPILY
jgi:DNA adenine methylase